MGNTVSFDYLARDKATGPTKALGRTFDETASKAGGLSKAFGAVTVGSRGLHTTFGLLGKGAAIAAGAAGLGGLIEGFKGVYSEAREAQKTGAQTNAVIKSTGGIAKVTADHVGDLATAISNKVGVDDEAIQSGANLLLTFTKVRNEAGKGNRIFDEATKTVTDMAAAMNNGAVTTDGLKSASIQVGKALNDPLKGITALTKVGVTFDEGQKKQIATLVKHHDTLGAQKIILGELNKEFGGSAAAGTTAGQKLGVVFGNIQETIGTALLPTIDKAATWFSKVLPGALQTASAIAGPIFRTLGDGFGGLAAAFSGEGITSDGFVGVMEQIGDKAGTFVGFVRGTIIPGFEALGSAFSGEGVTSDGFVGVMEQIGVVGKQTVDWIKTTLVPNIVTAFGSVKTRIGTALSGIDLSGIASTFTAEATKWGGALIAGVRTGLSTGDWSGLGETVGKGIASAIEGAGRLAKDIGSKIGDLMSKVDWVGIGISLGKQAPSLLIGLAAGILNFDLMGLLHGLAAHWQDVLLAVIAVAFTPARIIGKVGEVLARIPLVGKLLEWGLLHFSAFSKRLVGMVFDSLGFMGRAFLDGFRRVFPGVGARFGAELSILPTRLGLVAIAVRDRAALMMKRLADAIVGGIGRVVANIGELIGRMLRPFVNAGGWLVSRGLEFVGGLGRGIVGGIRAATGAAGRVIATVRAAFLNSGVWLTHAGGELISGLLSGARSALSGVGQWVKDIGGRIVGAVKGFFGIHSPSTVFAGLGGHLIGGLIKGMVDQNPTALVGKVFGGMTGALKTLFTKNLLGSVTSLPGKALNALGGLVSGGGGLLSRIFGGGGGGSNANSALGKQMAAAYGWTGGQWNALNQLWQGESGWNNNAQNPTSTAYGIAQFLNSTWGSVGASKTSDPAGQIAAGMQYIRQAYGDPANALSKWLSRSPHWYGSGMAPTVFSQPTLIGVGERGPETVSVVPHGRGGSAAGVAGVSVTVNLNGPVMGNAADIARQLGPALSRELADRLRSRGQPEIARALS